MATKSAQDRQPGGSVVETDPPPSRPNEITVRMMRTASIRPAPHNPPRRLDPDSRRTRKLIASVRRVGLLYPLTVSPRGELIDGHRRLVAVRVLGWKQVPVIVTGDDRDEVYAEANDNFVPHSTNDMLHVYIARPNAIPRWHRQRMEQMEGVIGTDLMATLRDSGGSLATYMQALKVAGYCDDPSPEMVRSVLAWLIRHRQTRIIRQALEVGVAPACLREAVAKGKPLSVTFGVTP